MAEAITKEQVKQVLTALGEDGLLDFPVYEWKNGVGYFEFTELSANLILATDEKTQQIADYINWG